MLRTADGQRVFDSPDIPALVALGDIAAILEAAREARVRHGTYGYVSAAAAHLLEQGHRLQFGCCSPEVRAAVAELRRQFPDRPALPEYAA